jgi:cytoskeleton-associated protein 5
LIANLLVRNFGANTAGVKTIVKFIPIIFQHADKNVRSEGSSLVVELSRWIGPAISACYEGLKPVQIKELQDAVAKLPKEVAHPLRWRRAEQPTMPSVMDVDMAVDSSTNVAPISVIRENVVDAFALYDPVNVLDKIPEGFNENLDSSKWKDRKDALDALLIVVKVPKIEDGQFGPLINSLAKKVSDVNVSVAATAAQCLEALANGLRKSFGNHRNEVIPALLERCKEKNKSVVESLRGALDATLHSVSSVSELSEVYGVFLKHKNPQVKSETLAWMSRGVPLVFKAQQAKKEIKTLTDVVLPCMDDSVADVRDAATVTLAALVKIGTEKQVIPFFEKLDKIKLAKVLETAKEGSAMAPGTDSVKAAPVPVQVTLKSTPAPSGPIQPTISELKPKIAAVPKAPTASKNLSSLSFSRTTDGAIDIMKQIFGEETLEAISDANWKNRLTAMDTIASKFEIVFPSEIDSEVLVRCFSAHPGWKESNFQVLGKVLSLLTLYAEKQSFTAEAASLAIPGLVEKIADPKLGTGVNLFLTAASERAGLSFIFECLEEPIKSQKNPKALSELYNWMASALLDFGISGLGINATVAMTKIGISNSNAMVRGAAIKVAVILRRFIGQDVKSLYSDVNGAQMSTLESEFMKVASEPAPVPIRRVKNASQNIPSDGTVVESTTMEVDTPQPINTEDLLPRNDVTTALATILSEISDANWKVRKEAMDKAFDIIKSAGGRIKLTNSTGWELYSFSR